MRFSKFILLMVSIVAFSAVSFTTTASATETGFRLSNRDYALKKRDAFLAQGLTASFQTHRKWLVSYLKVRTACEYWWSRESKNRKAIINECYTPIEQHYASFVPKAARNMIAGGDGFAAHYAARQMVLHAKQHGIKVDQNKLSTLLKDSGALRSRQVEKTFRKTGHYWSQFPKGCVASLNRFPKGKRKPGKVVHHVKPGQKLYVRCFMGGQLSDLMAGKEKPWVELEAATIDPKAKGGEYMQRLRVNPRKFQNKNYFDIVVNTGIYRPKVKNGRMKIVGGIVWISGYRKQWNKYNRRWEIVPLYKRINARLTLSYST